MAYVALRSARAALAADINGQMTSLTTKRSNKAVRHVTSSSRVNHGKAQAGKDARKSRQMTREGSTSTRPKQRPPCLPIRQWLSSINPALEQYAEAFKAHGCGDSSLLLVALQEDIDAAPLLLDWPGFDPKNDEREAVRAAKGRDRLVTWIWFGFGVPELQHHLPVGGPRLWVTPVHLDVGGSLRPRVLRP